MFERTDPLLNRVAAVARRMRQTRFWWLVAMIGVVASAIGLTLDYAVTNDIFSRQVAVIGLAIGFVAAVIAAMAINHFAFRDPRAIASKIENQFPSLQQRLLTAIGLLDGGSEPPAGYLQRKVIDDAYQHSLSHRWAETVSPTAIIASRVAGAISLVCVIGVAGLLMTSTSTEASSRVPMKALTGVSIEPGDTEIEKFSGLVISARFDSQSDLPTPVQLLVTDASSSSGSTMVMSQSLSDPVTSVYVPSIESSFDYSVVSPRWQSDTYHVEVFEYPAVTRCDAKMVYPEFTGMKEKTVSDTVRIVAVEGTQLSWTLQLNKPVSMIIIRDADGADAPFEQDAQAIRFVALLSKTTRWTVELIDEKGRKNKSPITIDARAIENIEPEIKLVQGGDIAASAIEEVSLSATVKDDFGLIRSGIALQFASGETKELTLRESLAGRETAILETLVELENYDVQTDQLLTYHFWAEDQSQGGQTRRTQSDLFFIEIRPFEEIFREGESPAGGQSQPSPPGGSQAVEELIELQKQIIAGTWRVLRNSAGSRMPETFGDDVDVLVQGQTQAMDQATEQASEIRDDKMRSIADTGLRHMADAVTALGNAKNDGSKDALNTAIIAEQSAYQSLLMLRAKEIEVSRSQRQPPSSSGSASGSQRQQQLDQLELKNDENRYETQSQATESQDESEAREQRQTLSRLKELAQRQDDINKQLAQLQSALQQASDEQAKEEIRRQLKRLRDQQQELIKDADELADRMQQPGQQESMNEQADRLAETRENMQQSSESLERDDAAEALASGTRAQRQLDDITDDVRKQTANQFDEALQDMRARARDLDKKQEDLNQQVKSLDEESKPGLRSDEDRDAVLKSLDDQKDAYQDLMKRVKQTVEDAEVAEPLLAQDLYETYREAESSTPDQKWSDAGELIRRGFDEQADAVQSATQESTRKLRQRLENAAESILGDEAKSLARANEQLEQLGRALQNEIAASKPSEEAASTSSEDGQSTDDENSQSSPSPGGRGSMLPPTDQPPSGGGGGSMVSPIAGGGFREWTDALRDVEEMVGDAELRSAAAAIRDRARQMRIQLKRHSESPKWSVVETMIAEPLKELKMKVNQEYLRLTAERTEIVPIDRDPVPKAYSGAVRRYYESLGTGN